MTQILSDELAACMLGEQSTTLIGFVRLGIESLERHLQSGNPLQTWSSPLHGMQLGQISSGHVTDLAMMQRLLARNHAFLASMAAFSPEAREDDADPPDDGAERWTTQVRHAVTLRNPLLDSYFMNSVRLTERGSTTRFDFLGMRLAAQLGRLIPSKNLSNQVKAAKAKLWDLENLRDSRHASAPSNPQGYELLLYHPRDDDPAFSDGSINNLHAALKDLEKAGDRQSLRVRPVHSADEAAEHIIQAEAT
ncbi:hypothetical protein [Thiorhodococcus fuscus]|uniref:TIGR03761 family integrating conjugative element protein n=1 Tax=Thiorhodococcus fuscus TaxID=527200 RepID=A0ABW4Y8N6_9GAMM